MTQENTPSESSKPEALKAGVAKSTVVVEDPQGRVMSSTALNAGIDEAGRGEVTAQTIGRLMGVATVSDLKLLESKVDLLGSKLTLFATKLDRVVTMLNGAPTGADLERIDVQIGSLKVLIKDVLAKSVGVTDVDEGKKTPKKILSNAAQPPPPRTEPPPAPGEGNPQG